MRRAGRVRHTDVIFAVIGGILLAGLAVALRASHPAARLGEAVLAGSLGVAALVGWFIPRSGDALRFAGTAPLGGFIVRGTPAGWAVIVVTAFVLIATVMRRGGGGGATRWLTATGLCVTALAGNALMVAIGTALAIVAWFIAPRPGGARVSRAALWAGSTASTCLVAGAVLMQQRAATGDLTALPAGAVNAPIALLWLTAAAILLRVALPRRAARADTGAGFGALMAVVGALAVLVALREAAAASFTSATVAITTVVAGALVVRGIAAAVVTRCAPAGAAAALWSVWSGLLVLLAVHAEPGLRLAFGLTALAAVFTTLVNTRRTAAGMLAWSAAAFAVCVALTDAEAAGHAGTASAVVIVVAAVAAALSALLVAARSPRSVWLATDPPTALITALVVAAAVAPGVAAWGVAAAVGVPAPASAWQLPLWGMEFPAGPLDAAIIVAAFLFARRWGDSPRVAPERHEWATARRLRSRTRTAVRGVSGWFLRADRWLEGQPRFGVLVAVAAAALVFVR